MINRLFYDISLEFKQILSRITNYIQSFVFISEENIAGLSIDNENVSYVSLTQKKKNYKKEAMNTRSYPISNIDHLGQALIKLEKSIGTQKSDSVVVTLPSHLFYSTILVLPRTLDDNQLRDAVESHKYFVSPVSNEEVYINWEKINSHNPFKQEVFLWIAKKEEINHYLESIKLANFLIRKIEPAALSIARIIKKSGPFILINLSQSDAHFSVIEREIPRLNYYVKFSDEKNHSSSSQTINIISKNILKLLTSYESEKTILKTRPIKKVMAIGDLSKESLLKISLATSLDVKLFHQQDIFKKLPIDISEPAFGATQQKPLPQDYLDQTIITNKKGYRENKIITVLKFWHNLSLKILGVLILVLIINYSFMILADKEISQKITSLTPDNFLEIIETSRAFNNDLTILTSVSENRISWSPIIENLSNITIPGIKISNISTNSLSKLITLNITIKEKSNIIELKNQIEKFGIFKKVIIPFEVLNSDKHIDFTLELELENKLIIK